MDLIQNLPIIWPPDISFTETFSARPNILPEAGIDIWSISYLNVIKITILASLDIEIKKLSSNHSRLWLGYHICTSSLAWIIVWMEWRSNDSRRACNFSCADYR